MQNDFWVFGYGSLMWRPGFVFAARHKAVVHGWRRRLCIYSHIYRGVPEKPGIVLGLDAGGECVGVAFQVGPNLREPTLRYLRERELISDVYIEKLVARASGERRKRHRRHLCRRPASRTIRRADGARATARAGAGKAAANRATIRNMSSTRATICARSALSIRSWNGWRDGCGRASRERREKTKDNALISPSQCPRRNCSSDTP